MAFMQRLSSIRTKFLERDKSLPLVNEISSTQLAHKVVGNATFASQQFGSMDREEIGQAISPGAQLDVQKCEPPTFVSLDSGHTGKTVSDIEIMARKERGRPGPSQSQSSVSNPRYGAGKLNTTRRVRTISGSRPAGRRPMTLLRRKRADRAQMNTLRSTGANDLESIDAEHAGRTAVDPDLEQQECERQTSRQVPSSLASPSHEGQRSNTRRKLHNIIQRAKSEVIILRDKTLRRKRPKEETNKQGQSTVHSPVCHEEALIRTTHEDHPAATHCTEGDAPVMELARGDALHPEVAAGGHEEVEKLRRDLSDSRFQVAELQRRCEAQSKELQGSSVFFSTADKSSDFDIIRACQRLNAELQQNTTYMAECLKEAFEFHNLVANPTAEQIAAVQRVSDHIGPVLANGLVDSTPVDLTMLLQTAFQTRLASALSLAASSWALEPGHNTFIYGIYQRLRSVEAQAISGRWRMLARVHTCNWSTQPEPLVAGIVADFSEILLAAGCAAPHSDITSKVTSRFKETLTSLVELAIRLGQMFDDVVSSDFEVFLPRPGIRFEDSMMEDVDGDQVVPPEALVLCATNLGLIKRIPVGTSLWVKGRKEKITVLKPQVLLESSLDGE